LDPQIVFPTTNWTNVGSEQIVINGAANPDITPGTVLPIATFDASGHYDPAHPHAAVFLGYGSENTVPGFFMFDQYTSNDAVLNTAVPPHPAEVRFYEFSNPLASEYWTIHV
jgi:hypothetical protein